MKEARQWWSEIDGARGTWLLLGKGRSLERVNEFDLSSFRTLSLNHVVREISVEAASIIDIEVVADCGEVLDRNARFLLMPRYPHVKTSATDRPLEGFFSEFPVLEKLSREGRLVWYNFATGKPQPSSPQIPEGYFSGEVIVSLLAIWGARSIRTLGMDGSTSYFLALQGHRGKDQIREPTQQLRPPVAGHRDNGPDARHRLCPADQ